MSELLRRAVQVLEVLRASDRALSIRQVADQAGVSKSTVQRLLRELTATELVAQDRATQRYHLGPRTLALGTAYQKRLDVRQVALGYMTKLRDATGETVGLSVGYGDQLMHIDQVESESTLRARFDIGRPLPLWSGAPSRLLLAERDDHTVYRIVAAHEQGDVDPVHPPTPEQLLTDVATARDLGYALAVEETLPGVSTLSGPIRDATGVLVATLSLTSPTTRLTEPAIEQLLPQLLTIASQISRDLGWVPPQKSVQPASAGPSTH
jgi:DNA-binding IclR family transcriptional regulator